MLSLAKLMFFSKILKDIHESTQLRKVEEQRHLGLILSSDLRWTEHTNRVLSKAARLLHTLSESEKTPQLALQASSGALLLSVHSSGN